MDDSTDDDAADALLCARLQISETAETLLVNETSLDVPVAFLKTLLATAHETETVTLPVSIVLSELDTSSAPPKVTIDVSLT